LEINATKLRKISNIQIRIWSQLFHIGAQILGLLRRTAKIYGLLRYFAEVMGGEFSTLRRTVSVPSYRQRCPNFRGSIYEGWNFNNGNYLFTTDTK